jgi:hypothetical protein
MKNILNLVNLNLKKFFKGYLMLIALGISISFISLIIQSCSKNEIFEDNAITQARHNFLNSAKIGLSNLNKIDVNSKNKSSFAKSTTLNEDFATISVYESSGSNFTDFNTLYNVSSFRELTSMDGVELEVSYIDGSTSDNISDSQELINSYSISIEAAKQSLEPTLVESKNYLRSKGLTDNDIQNLLTADEYGPAMSESDLIPAVMQLVAEEQNQNSMTSINFSNVFFQSAHASEIGECAGDALGVADVALALSGGLQTSAGKALLKKAIRKVATRALGWVGAAVFAYEFGDCMGWW